MYFELLEKMCERNESRDFVLCGKTRRATSLFQSHITCLLEIHVKTIAESTYVRLTSSSHTSETIKIHIILGPVFAAVGILSHTLEHMERDQ